MSSAFVVAVMSDYFAAIRMAIITAADELRE